MGPFSLAAPIQEPPAAVGADPNAVQSEAAGDVLLAQVAKAAHGQALPHLLLKGQIWLQINLVKCWMVLELTCST